MWRGKLITGIWLHLKYTCLMNNALADVIRYYWGVVHNVFLIIVFYFIGTWMCYQRWNKSESTFWATIQYIFIYDQSLCFFSLLHTYTHLYTYTRGKFWTSIPMCIGYNVIQLRRRLLIEVSSWNKKSRGRRLLFHVQVLLEKQIYKQY